jgi:hypothetical protein
MTSEELQIYLDQLSSRLPLDRYIERRFTAHVAPTPAAAPPTQTIVVRVESANPAVTAVATPQSAATVVTSAPVQTLAVPTNPASGTQVTGTTASAPGPGTELSLGEIARQNRARKAQQAAAEQSASDTQTNQP